jgi:hypothetical protein
MMRLAHALFLALAAAAPPDDADERTLREAGMGTDGPTLIAFFRKRVGTEAALARARELAKQLGDDSFERREKASAELAGMGRVALPALRGAARERDAEVVRRARDCMRQIESESMPAIAAAAVHRLAVCKPAGGAAVLLDYLPFADSEGVAEEVRAALPALAVADGKSDPGLVKALADTSAIKRAAAAEALGRAGAKLELPALRRLLKDPDPGVRLRTGLGLLALREREAVPALITLLGELPPERAWPIEDVLNLLAGQAAPTVALGQDEAGRKRCRDAWDAWWHKFGDRTDLARLDDRARQLGFTLVLVQQDGNNGRVMEVTSTGTVRWQIDGLRYPLDAHMIDGERVLIAESAGSRVTERNLRGEILWEKTASGVCAAQRLPNGNVFMATGDSRLVEVDRAGNDIRTYKLARQESVMAVQMLRDGQIGYVAGRDYVHLDANGKELRRWPVGNVVTRGGLDLLPGGGVLVARVHEDKVVEFDRDGKQVWEAAVQHPTSVVRLRNGNSLVAGWNTGLVVELDRAGQVVWQYKTSGEMSRARRR